MHTSSTTTRKPSLSKRLDKLNADWDFLLEVAQELRDELRSQLKRKASAPRRQGREFARA